MRHGHELYCLGHLIQAGIAWQSATGEKKYLEVAGYLLGGVLALQAKASRPRAAATDRPLYERYGAWPPVNRVEGQVTLIPYYTFANRGTTTMQVWVPVE